MYRITKRAIVRSLAFLGWLCFVFAPAKTLAQRVTTEMPDAFLSSAEVYDYWCENLSDMDWPFDTWCATNADAASLAAIQQPGFAWRFVVGVTNLHATYELIVSNRLAWLGPYPVFNQDIVFPTPGDLVGFDGVSPLVNSILSSFSRLETVTNPTPFAASVFPLVNYSGQPHGKVIRTGIRVTLDNPIIGYYCFFVPEVPTAWSRYGYYAVTPDVYEEIMGSLPWDLPPAALYIEDDEKTKWNIRFKERWK